MQNQEQEDYHFRFKVVVLGDTKSGKSTFLDTLTDSFGKVMNLETSEELSERTTIQAFEHLIFRITFWEIPGKERHLGFLKNYCLGAAVAIILYDTTKVNSFEKAQRILKAIENCDIPIKLLIGNKMDLLATKKNLTNPVVQQDAQTLAKNFQCFFFNCNSAEVNYVTPIYNAMMTNIYQLIGGNLDLRNIIGKNISVGKKLFTHPNFIQSLKDAQYFKD